MKIQVIKKETPEEISEAGGCSMQIVNKETTDLDTSINEAKDQLCVVGNTVLIKGEFVGLFKSMIKGIERDGNARTLGDFLTLYPVATGEFDLDKGWDPAVNGVKICARLMSEMNLDISTWEFEDVTPGRVPFKLESVKAGDALGIVELNKMIEINGKPLPTTDDIRIDWAVLETTQAGTIPAAKVTSTVTRANIAADALSALNVPANDGKAIAFTVRGNYANATIRAVLKYVAPTGPTLTRIEDEEGHVGPTIGAGHDQDFLIGTNLAEATSVTMNGTSAGTPYMLNCEIKAKTATKLTINIPTDKFVSGDNQILLTVSTPAGIATLNANMEV